MLFKNLLKLTSLIFLPLIYSNANALSIGLYGTAANSGTAEWDDYYNSCFFSSCSTPSSFETDIDQKEFGFVLDTSTARNKLYSYRLQVGLVDVSYDELDFDGVVFTNTFGFGVVRNENFRFWIGPQVSLKILDSKNFNDYELDTLGLGVATGFNFHINSVVSLTAEAGLRHGFGVAEYNSYYGDEYDITEERFFLNVGILFRFGDSY